MAQFVLGNKEDYVPYDGDADGERDFPVVPEYTRLICEVVKVEEKEKRPEARFDEYDLTEISFRVKCIDGKYAKQQFFGNTKPSFTWHDKCKFRHWVEAIIGVPKDGLPGGFELDLPALTGMKCDVIMGVRIRKKDNKEMNYIRDILPHDPANAQSTFGS